jgi:hypothetical protein
MRREAGASPPYLLRIDTAEFNMTAENAAAGAEILTVGIDKHQGLILE